MGRGYNWQRMSIKPGWHEFAVDTISKTLKSISPKCYWSITFVEHLSVLCKALAWHRWALNWGGGQSWKDRRIYMGSVKEVDIAIFYQRSSITCPIWCSEYLEKTLEII